MSTLLKFVCLAILGSFFAACAVSPPATKNTSPTETAIAGARRFSRVRTTAYTHTEQGGRHNAIGSSLSGKHVMSAASDWSRFPLGTHFRVVGTNDEYMIDDYGTALVGTNTIDLYKRSRLEMRRWGVRHIDIDILQWGSEEKSVKVLAPRAKHSCARQMLGALKKKAAARLATMRTLN
jgi:3D (Asp-Asp-Asp) domain-containing protein